MERITSLDNQKIKAALKSVDKAGPSFLIEGFHNVEMASEHGLLDVIFSLVPSDIKAPTSYLINEKVLKKLTTSKTPEGIVGLCHKKEPQAFSSERLLYLDDIQDPGNLGTLLRSALAFGFKDVLLSKCTADPYGAKALLAGQGAIFGLNVISSKEDTFQDIQLLKTSNYFLIATSLKDSIPFEGYVPPKKPLALLLGNEGNGLKEIILNNSDVRLRISMSSIDSLNVGIAGGIVMHEFRL